MGDEAGAERQMAALLAAHDVDDEEELPSRTYAMVQGNQWKVGFSTRIKRTARNFAKTDDCRVMQNTNVTAWRRKLSDATASSPQGVADTFQIFNGVHAVLNNGAVTI